MHFSALRLTGFKSFLEPTELEISPGLTGIVGPNGCGKSNLVEALRWVMGESSAKRMRGGEMDDVIFGGSDKRPARNLAEVSLAVENASRTAPAQFNGADQLEIVRRIERGSGSDYRVNGKSVRAKDVSILFQDNGTGPHSASLVSQGRIGALIAAKPTEKRVLLEEAAGITGLHARRHEAELRLKQAETNLLRVEDVMGTMDAQLQLLKKQARQASRYRNINAELRRQEAALFYLRWVALQLQLEDANTAFTAADGKVAELMLEVAQLENARLNAAEALPPLRQKESTQAAALQRLVLAREQIDSEAARIAAAAEAAQNRLNQAETDRVREASLAEDARRALEGIDAETIELKAADDTADTQRESLMVRVSEAVAAREQAEQAVAALQQKIALAEAEAASAQRRHADLTQRRERSENRRSQSAAERAKIEAEQMSDLFVSSAQREAQQAEQVLTDSAAAIESSEQKRSLADTTVVMARERVQQAESAVSSLNAEKSAIERILAAGQSDYPPVIDNISAQRGYEQALAVALGDDLVLPLDGNAPVYWQNLPAYDFPPVFPPDITPLSNLVSAPPALARRLALIGVASDAARAGQLSGSLLPGQCLVTTDGAAWRWDCVCLKPGAPTPSALRLQQRNRLGEIEAELVAATALLEEERGKLTAALNTATTAVAAVRNAREQHNQALAELTRARRAASEAEAAMTAHASKLATARDTEARMMAELEAVNAEMVEVEAARAALPDLSASRTELAEGRAALSAKQAEAADAEAARRQFEREHEQRSQRIAVLATERERWIQRSAGASQRMVELETRSREAQQEIEQISGRPAELEAQRNALVEQIQSAEEARTSAADLLAVAETELRERERELKQAESQMTDSRESRATAQAQAGAVTQAQAALVERIREKCECDPEGLAELAELREGQPIPEPETIEARVEKILREREALGPVNLRAEQEAEEQQQNIDKMLSEKTDLVEAIAKLRHGISSLNREARERLMDAYGKVQQHFKRLFTELFGGGTAEIKLTEAEYPLEAGLEVIASPPGKKLQNLSLLSGCEQALTSLALLFAVFLVNPSPICVLDEVDAPLDEANIDRFCGLLDRMVTEGTTRFLVITHQRLTMSRMNRLYGVTMMERGVSKLVSVDLSAAEELQEAA